MPSITYMPTVSRCDSRAAVQDELGSGVSPSHAMDKPYSVYDDQDDHEREPRHPGVCHAHCTRRPVTPYGVVVGR